MIRFYLPRYLLSPDAGEGSTPEPQPSAPAAPAPPAASTVSAGEKVEADVAADMDMKKLQQRIAQLEDQNRQLSEAQRLAASPQPAPAVAAKKSWLDGGSFFD